MVNSGSAWETLARIKRGAYAATNKLLTVRSTGTPTVTRLLACTLQHEWNVRAPHSRIEDGIMELRWVSLIALWTILSGPVIGPSASPSPARAKTIAAAKSAISPSHATAPRR